MRLLAVAPILAAAALAHACDRVVDLTPRDAGASSDSGFVPDASITDGAFPSSPDAGALPDAFVALPDASSAPDASPAPDAAPSPHAAPRVPGDDLLPHASRTR